MAVNARVCHISSVHSGVEIRIVRKQLATLARAGFDANLVIPASAAEVVEMRAMGITTDALTPAPGSGEVSRMVRLGYQAMVKARRFKADLYHFHDPELIPYALWLKALGNRVIMDVHEDLAGVVMHKQWIHPALRRPVASLSRSAEIFGARRFDAVVAAVPYLGEVFRPYAKRCVVVGNFPFLDELAQGSDPAPWQTRQKIAYVGSVSRIRGIFELVQALPALNLKLQLAGKFMHSPEFDEIQQQPGWPMVENRGWVGRAEIRDILATSFAGLCTLYPTSSHLIAEPIKLFEYMAAGIPVVSSNIPYYEQIVKAADCGICVDPKSSTAIADAVRYLRDHPLEAQRMGRNGRAAVLGRYNWHQEGEKLLALYRDVLASGKRA
jgi:glycosyltransferase involved in cell wall biosynthesis